MRMSDAGRNGVGVCMLLTTYITCYAVYLLLVSLAGKGNERVHNFLFFSFRIVGWASGLGVFSGQGTCTNVTTPNSVFYGKEGRIHILRLIVVTACFLGSTLEIRS